MPAFNSSTWEAEAGGFLVYRESFRIVRAIQKKKKKPVLKKKRSKRVALVMVPLHMTNILYILTLLGCYEIGIDK
jgi:hypothetical protein